MSSFLRLSDDDVRTIFECLHGDQQPPERLKFKIVEVEYRGLRLSPPSYEFEVGLYVLLRPWRAREARAAPDQLPRAPPHLLDYVLSKYPPETCSWSLSGPQIPPPTTIQQRYCYPKGDPQYSSRRGGAVWTMYGPDGREDVEYRLLNVYESSKRSNYIK